MFRRYVENGLSVIPLIGKRPILKDWQQYNDHLPTEEDIDRWENVHGKKNVGLCVGPASGVMAIDIDTDDTLIKDALPRSNIARRGKKGEVRFFKYNSDIPTNKYNEIKVEIFSDKGQLVLPPSIHPETKEPYVWLTPLTFEDPLFRDQLIELNPNELSEIIDKLRGDVAPNGGKRVGPLTRPNSDRCPNGAHNQLRTVAHAIVAKRLPFEQAAKELYDFDFENHKPLGYFWDKTRSDYICADPWVNCIWFYTNILASVNEKNEKSKRPIEAPARYDLADHSDIEVIQKPPVEKHKLKPLPELPGLLGELKADILKNSPVQQPVYATAGAIGIVSTLALGKYSLFDQWPNIYQLILCETSGGKSLVRGYVANLFLIDEFRDYNRSGLGSYVSDVATIADLPKQRWRIDCHDELSQFIRNCARSDGRHRGVATILTELWSNNGRFFKGIKAITRGDADFACDSPAINILGVCQESTFAQACNDDMFELGFIPRFLVYNTDEKPTLNLEFEGFKKNRDLYNEIKRIFPNTTPALDLGPTPLAVTDAARARLKEVRIEIFNKIHSLDSSQAGLKATYGKAYEHIMRLTIVFTLAKDLKTVDTASVDLSKEFIETIISNSQSILDQSRGSDYQKKLTAMREFIKTERRVTREKLGRRYQYGSDLRKRIIQDLIEQKFIREDGKYLDWIVS